MDGMYLSFINALTSFIRSDKVMLPVPYAPSYTIRTKQGVGALSYFMLTLFNWNVLHETCARERWISEQ